MAEIVLTRIDDRLLHGQVAKSWVPKLEADLIVIANDEVKNDEQAKKLMNISVPLYTDSLYLRVDEVVDELKSYEDKRALILIASPKDAYELVKSGLDIKTINLGNMRKFPDKEQIRENIYLGEEDKTYLKKLKDEGINIDVRILSQDQALDLKI